MKYREVINFVSKIFCKYKALYMLLWCFICFVIYMIYSSSSKGVSEVSKPINQTTPPPHVLCVLVPHRNRFEELIEFVPYMSKFLKRQSIHFHIVVINHVPDEYRFNKGSSYNAGFRYISKNFPECDYIALHDIDMLPLNNNVSYSYPGKAAFHAIPPGLHPYAHYSFTAFIGAILLISNDNYILVNGLGNNFWGWGFEDHDFQRRLNKHSIPITRPTNLYTDRTNTFKHLHEVYRRERDVEWCDQEMKHADIASNIDRTSDNSGLSDLDYSILSENTLTIDGFPFSLLNIKIGCKVEEVPWCKPYTTRNDLLCGLKVQANKLMSTFKMEEKFSEIIVKAINDRVGSSKQSNAINRPTSFDLDTARMFENVISRLQTRT